MRVPSADGGVVCRGGYKDDITTKGLVFVDKDERLVVGDKVDFVTTDDDEPYRAMIGDIKRDGSLYTSIPTSAGLPMSIQINDELIMTYYRESGRYALRVKVTDLGNKDKLRYVVLEQLAEPEKDQRRMFYRLPVSLNAIICEYIENIEEHIPKREDVAEAVSLESAEIKDVSITGIALITKRDYTPGDKYILKLFFEEKQRSKAKPFVICAEVTRTEYERKNKTYRVGMQFFGQTQKMRDYLAKYVLKQQQKQIVQRRYVEGVK